MSNTTLTVTQLLDENAVDTLTNTSLTPVMRQYILMLMNGKDQETRDRVSFLIDNTCTYVRFSESAALVEGQQCDLEDWHELAKMIRGYSAYA